MYLFNIIDSEISQQDIVYFIDYLLDNNIINFILFVDKKQEYKNHKNYLVYSDDTDTIINFYKYFYDNYDEIMSKNIKILYLNLDLSMIQSKIDLIYEIKKIYSSKMKYINITNALDTSVYDETNEHVKNICIISGNFNEQEIIEEVNHYIIFIMKIKEMYKKLFEKDIYLKKFYYSECGFFIDTQYSNINKKFLELLFDIFDENNTYIIITLTEAIFFGTLSINEPLLLELKSDQYHIDSVIKDTEIINNNDIINDVSNNNIKNNDISNTNNVARDTEIINNNDIINDVSNNNILVKNTYITNFDCINCTKFNFSGKPHLFTYFCSIQCRDFIMNIQEKIPV